VPILLLVIILGIVEGVTEFIPVSSTGHLILANELLGYDAHQFAVFNVVIQLGAILAVIVLYWRTFMAVLIGLMKNQPESWRFVRNIVVAFLPSAILGLLIHRQIEAMLGNASIVPWALILGGIAILGIEKFADPKGEESVAELPLRQVIGVGLAQCLAMIPGVSRSGATIMGALAMGVNRKTAAEFSFFLAVPTMIGATTLELIQKGDQLTSGRMSVGWAEIAIGFAVSFVVALVVIRVFVAYVSRHGFAPFAWYRIVVGAAAIAWLALR
jgi:undecaprenyl-diphosphatase